MSLDDLVSDVRAPILFALAFMLSGCGGVGWLLRSVDKSINFRTFGSAFLNSGLLGLAVSGIWYLTYQENVVFLLGICCATGIAGTPLVDFVSWCESQWILRYLEKRFGVRIYGDKAADIPVVVQAMQTGVQVIAVDKHPQAESQPAPPAEEEPK